MAKFVGLFEKFFMQITKILQPNLAQTSARISLLKAENRLLL
jgi:hypothetical protein